MDADDRLSHQPSNFSEVAREAAEWGLAVVLGDVPDWCWATLEDAIKMLMSSEDAEWISLGSDDAISRA